MGIIHERKRYPVIILGIFMLVIGISIFFSKSFRKPDSIVPNTQIIHTTAYPTKIPTVQPTDMPIDKTEREIKTFMDSYMQAIISHDWMEFRTLLTADAQKQFTVDFMPTDIGSYTIISVVGPDTNGNYYVRVAMYNKNTGKSMLVHGDYPTITVRNEQGMWKSMTTYIFE